MKAPHDSLLTLQNMTFALVRGSRRIKLPPWQRFWESIKLTNTVSTLKFRLMWVDRRRQFLELLYTGGKKIEGLKKLDSISSWVTYSTEICGSIDAYVFDECFATPQQFGG